MTVKEAYEKIKKSEDLKKAGIEAVKSGKVDEFLKENGFDITIDQIKEYLESKLNTIANVSFSPRTNNKEIYYSKSNTSREYRIKRNFRRYLMIFKKMPGVIIKWSIF